MRIRVALCDNDPKALSVIAGATESVFRDRGFHPLLDRFENGGELLAGMEQKEYQIVLLDIDMPEMDGIQAAKVIRGQYPRTRVVFVSNYEERVFEALLAQPLGFVRKSNFFEDLTAVIGLYTDSWTGGDDPSQVEFVGRNGPVKLEGKRIRYIEGSRNYQILYPVEGTPVEVKQTMDKLSAEDQQIIFECAKEAEIWHRDAWEASEAKNAEIALEKGCTLTTLTADEQKAFQEAVAPMYDSFLNAEQKAIVERVQALG